MESPATHAPSELDGIYREYHPRVLALCRRLLADRAAAEDAAADVFARLPDALRSYEPARRSFASWLLTVAANRCVDRLRRRARERKIFADDEPVDPRGGPDPLQALLDAESRARVSAAVDALPDRYRIPLVLRFCAEQSYAEIAETLELQPGHVASLLFRGRQRLREALGEDR